ncbi:MAG: hypothetical protein AB1714_09200 [Acidobacteriota bacterium]
MKVSRLFSEDETKRVNDAIASAEEKTSGEIIPVVVPQSSDYREVAYLGGLAGALVTYFVAIYLTRVDSPSRVLLTLAAGYIAGLLASRIPAIKRLLIGRQFSEDEVWRRAALEFHLNRAHRTSAHTGIIILLSLLERTVVVYGDQPIAEKVRQEEWDGARDAIVDGIRGGQAAEGLAAGIARCGEILAMHFPIQRGDQNELPNRLVLRDS